MKFRSICSVIAILSLLTACGEVEKPQDNPNNQKALVEIRKEPRIAEALITDANVLYVSVKGDGSREDGYAQYLCQVLSDQQATTKHVKVVQVGTAGKEGADNAFGVLLGEADCKAVLGK